MTASVGPINADLMIFILENQQRSQGEAATARDTSHELGIAMLSVSHVYREIEQKQQEFDRTMAYINAATKTVGAATKVESVVSGDAIADAPQSDGASAGDGGSGGGGRAPNIGNAPNPSAASSGAAAQAAGAADGIGQAGDATSPVADAANGDAPQGAGQAAADADGTAEPQAEVNAIHRMQWFPGRGEEQGLHKTALDLTMDLGPDLAKGMVNHTTQLAGRSRETTKRAADAIERGADKADESRDEERELTQEVIDTMLPNANRNLVG